MSEVLLDRSMRIVVGRREPYGVACAARAVAQDIFEVAGFRPRVVEESSDAAGVEILVESDGKLARARGIAAPLAPETFVVRALCAGGRPTLLISGCGERGAIYGLYHLAEAHLGADPFKHLTGYRPPARCPIVLKDPDFTAAPPAFRFRGWHIESHGLMSPWRGTAEHQHANWERFFETLLRCGGNMVKPEINRPESLEVATAQRMGLLITQEHGCPFGVGMWEVGAGVPGFDYSYERSAETYLEAWEDGLRRYPDPTKVIWTVAFRGRGDRPFWETDPERYDTDAKRGALIERVMQAQKALVEKHLGRGAAPLIFNAWMEGNRLLSEGHLHPPEGAYTVWADNGYGSFRSMIAEGCPPEQVKDILPASPPPGMHGVYYHVAMWDFCAPFLTRFVPPERIEREFRRVVERGMTAYVLVNVGRLSHSLLSAAAIADLWRDPSRWVRPEAHGEEGGAAGFLRRWTRRYFGAAAGEAAECYRRCQAGFVRYGEWGGWDDYVFGDVGYARIARGLVQQALSAARRRENDRLAQRFFENRPMTLAEQLAWLTPRLAQAETRWTEALELAEGTLARLEGTARRFFEADIAAQIEINLGFNGFLRSLAEAVTRYERGEFAAALRACRAAKTQAHRAWRGTRRVDHGNWGRGWPKETFYRITCLPLAWEQAEMLERVCKTIVRRRNDPLLLGVNMADTGWEHGVSGPTRTFEFEKPPDEE